MTIAIVGAGIHGLTLAWALIRSGHAVTLLDRAAIPNPDNASFDQHRLIHDHAGVESEAFAAWEVLSRDIGVHLVTTGVLRVHADPIQAARSLDDLTAAGVTCTRLDADALRRLAPGIRPAAAYGVLTARGGVLLADRIAAALASWLSAHGAVLRPWTAVAAIDSARGILTLESGERLDPEQSVIAVGAWSARLVPALADRVGARRQVVAYLRPPHDRRAAWRRAPVFVGLGADDAHWGAPPVAETDLKLAAGSLARAIGADEYQTAAVSAAEIAALLGCYRSVIPDIDRYEVLRAKACVYATGRSGGLFAEPIDPGRRVWVIGGGDGGDYKRAPATALALATRLRAACARS